MLNVHVFVSQSAGHYHKINSGRVITTLNLFDDKYSNGLNGSNGVD